MAESERQKLDLNIDNWTVEDLYDLFDIPKNASTNQVASMADKVIERQTEGEIKYFLQLARNKIINAQQSKLEGDQYTERTDEQLKIWWQNQYLTTGDATQAEKATIRTNKVEIFDDENGHYQMKQNRLGVNNTHHVSFLQGTMNPTLVNEVERTVIIDSQYRTNIYPYSGGSGFFSAFNNSEKSVLGNPTSPSFNTDFTLTLSENLANVLELKLDSVSIPKTWSNFSPFIGNSRFGIYDSSSNNTFMIDLPEMSPATPNDLVTVLNQEIHARFGQQLDISGVLVDNPYLYIANDIKFEYVNVTNKIIIDVSNANLYPDPSLNYGSGTEYEFIWFNRELFSEQESNSNNTDRLFNFGANCFNVEFTNNNFGWSIGFRETPDLSSNKVSSNYKTQVNGVNVLVADTTPKLKTIDYLVVVLDDFNKNRLNTGIISGVEQSTKLAIPQYTNADNLNCNEQGDQPFFSKVAPRQLTQAQLYTINSIVEDRQKSKNRNSAPTLSDAFCTIPVPSNIEQNDRIVLYSNQLSTAIRKYFGPVNIERVRAILYDDRGNIVNLRGHDWSFTLKTKQLYQY